MILHSTRDLESKDMPENAVYFPNPVGTELFHPGIGSPNLGRAFTISYFADDIARNYSKEYNLRLTIHDRDARPILHRELPTIPRQYEYYIDI